MGRFNGKVALVTGSSRGIGYGIAEAFAKEGASVVINSLHQEKASAVAAEMANKYGIKTLAVAADIADETQVRNMVAEIERTFGQIDILVNNAGNHTQKLVRDMTVEEWDWVVNCQLRGTFLVTRFVLPVMLKQGSGKIIMISSQLAQKGAVEMAHYCAGNAGIIGFTRALAREVIADNIYVNAIAPGPIETDAFNSMSDEWRAQKASELPLGRFGNIEEIAPTALFLACDDSSLYVGQVLGPNCGDVMF